MGNNDGGCLGLFLQLCNIFCNDKQNQQNQQQQNGHQMQPPQGQGYGYPGANMPTFGQPGQQGQHGQQGAWGQGAPHQQPGQHGQQHHPQGVPHGNAGDSANATQLRNDARREGDKAHKCFADSQAAYKSGDGARAHELSQQGKAHQSKRDALDDQAANYIFAENNRSQPRGTIDLHGLYVSEALARVDAAIADGKQEGRSELRVITGKGLHSAGGQAKIKPAVADMMRRYNLSADVDPHNPGVVVVNLAGGGGHLSRSAGEMLDKDDGCNIM